MLIPVMIIRTVLSAALSIIINCALFKNTNNMPAKIILLKNAIQPQYISKKQKNVPNIGLTIIRDSIYIKIYLKTFEHNSRHLFAALTAVLKKPNILLHHSNPNSIQTSPQLVSVLLYQRDHNLPHQIICKFPF